jgi:hypothetical protein
MASFYSNRVHYHDVGAVGCWLDPGGVRFANVAYIKHNILGRDNTSIGGRKNSTVFFVDALVSQTEILCI